MTFEMKLKDVYFDKIKSGQKIYEIRLNDEKRKPIEAGDIILFKKESDLQQVLTTIVEEKIFFKSFREMAGSLPLNEVGFENMATDEVEKIYHSFYSVDNEQKFGVVAFKIKLKEDM